MRSLRARVLLLCIAVLAGLLAGCSSTGNTNLPQERVLFIGNSFTYYNDGINQVLKGLAPNTTVDSATQGGYTIANHLNDPNTMNKLRGGDWTRVVIQEQSVNAILNYPDFIDSAKRMVAEVHAVHASPLLLMTWARPDVAGVTTPALKTAFARAGKELSAKVIPAGAAFGISLAAHPGIKLNEHDGHPTKAGTYLAGCVVYATVFGISPVGNTFTGGLDAGVTEVLQDAAAVATGHGSAHS
jgi:hypothetical protein